MGLILKVQIWIEIVIQLKMEIKIEIDPHAKIDIGIVIKKKREM